MSIRKSLFALAALALLASGQNANAGLITGLFNTGAGVAPGSIDTHYTVASGIYTGAAVTETPANQPGVYVTSPLSQWISTQGNPGTAPGGTYTYTTTFFDTDANGRIVINVASDDTVVILLNGVQVGAGSVEFSAFTPITVSSGFALGLNTLQFVVTNNPAFTPEGLNVNYVNASLVPEPASLGMVALGIAATGFVGVRRRRRTV